MEEIRMESPMPKVEIDSLSTRSYLDHTVVPVIMDAMVAVAKLRYLLVIVCVHVHQAGHNLSLGESS